MGSAALQGSLWGERSRDYAETLEVAFIPLYEAVLEQTGVGPETSLLDVGCGPGLFARLAAERGARVSGLDAAESSIDIARERTPDGDFRVGEMEELPWPDSAFEVVTGFNAFQFAADRVNALREAARVARPDGLVAIALWGPDDECETPGTIARVRALLPSPPRPSREPPFAAPGRAEELLRQAGLSPRSSGRIDCEFRFPTLETAIRAFASAGAVAGVIRQVGEERVCGELARSLGEFRTPDGHYVQRNTFRYIVANR